MPQDPDPTTPTAPLDLEAAEEALRTSTRGVMLRRDTAAALIARAREAEALRERVRFYAREAVERNLHFARIAFGGTRPSPSAIRERCERDWQIAEDCGDDERYAMAPTFAEAGGWPEWDGEWVWPTTDAGEGGEG